MEGNVASLCLWDFAEWQVGPRRCGWPRRFFGENRDQGQPVSWQCRTTSRIHAYTGLDEFRPIRLGFKMFGLELGGARDPSLGSRPVFVDPADL
jgi:hypothetical protein